MRTPFIEGKPWRKWYAWYPVVAYSASFFHSWPDTSYLVWLEDVWWKRQYSHFKWRTIYHINHEVEQPPVDSPYEDKRA
jgi:hypothetical protein